MIDHGYRYPGQKRLTRVPVTMVRYRLIPKRTTVPDTVVLQANLIRPLYLTPWFIVVLPRPERPMQTRIGPPKKDHCT